MLKIVEFETLEICREWLDLDGHCLVLIGTLIRSLASSYIHDDDDVYYEITVTSSSPTRLCRLAVFLVQHNVLPYLMYWQETTARRETEDRGVGAQEAEREAERM